MELRLDRLLALLREDTAGLLARIDADPLLTKRTNGDLVLANASKALFTPVEPHQMFAKGVVYRRDPFRLVSLPLVKIFNLGEREVTAADIAAMTDEAGHTGVHFLRKMDGTLIQRFQDGGRVYFTTRGVLEGVRYTGAQDEDAPGRLSHFDFLGETRAVAARHYPQLLDVVPEWDRFTLLFEFLHPETRVVTDYGDRRDLVLIAAFDRANFRDLPYRELTAFAERHRLTAVGDYVLHGHGLAERIDDLRARLLGTDEEGTVLTVEHGDEIAYRVKVKSADYLRMLKLMVSCTYPRTAEMLDARPEWTTWEPFEAFLKSQGNESVPEEVLTEYRTHQETHLAYLRDCERLKAWAEGEAARIRGTLPDADERATRKAFAEVVKAHPAKPLLFTAFGGKLTLRSARDFAPSPDAARAATEKLTG
jgi:hypothetical protein